MNKAVIPGNVPNYVEKIVRNLNLKGCEISPCGRNDKVLLLFAIDNKFFVVQYFSVNTPITLLNKQSFGCRRE